jgi:hypothetical protein
MPALTDFQSDCVAGSRQIAGTRATAFQLYPQEATLMFMSAFEK